MINYDGDRLLEVAANVCPASFSLIRGDEPLREYARRLYSNGSAVGSVLARQSRDLLAGSLERHLRSMGVDGSKARMEVESDLVIQTGPHHRLAFDDDYCSTLAFSLIGSSAADKSMNILFNCSTVTLEEQSHRGPAWLRNGGTATRVFDLPRRLLAKRSMVAFHDHVEVSGDVAAWVANNLPAGTEIDVKGGRMPAREHISRINGQLFAQLAEGTGITTVALQEDFFGHLIAKSLDEASFLRRLFDDGRVASMVGDLHQSSLSPTGSFVPNSTDLFWAMVGGRVRPLKLVDNCLRSEKYDIDIALEPDGIARLLRSGLLVPNLFLIFCVASILPLGRALGGSYQAVYHEVFVRVFLNALDRRNPDELDLAREIESRVLAGWGHNVVAHNALADLISTQRGSLTFADQMGDRALVDVSSSFAAFVDDDRWQALASYVSTGMLLGAAHPLAALTTNKEM